MRRSVAVLAVVAATAAAGAPACTSAEEPSSPSGTAAPSATAEPGPAGPAGSTDPADPLARVAPPAAGLVPATSPDGLSLLTVTPESPYGSSDDAWLAVHRAGDVTVGLAVEGGDDGGAGFPSSPGDRPLVGDRRTATGTTGDLSWIAWPVEGGTGSDQAMVFGRGVDQPALVAIAEQAAVDGDPAGVDVPAGALPEGAELVAEGPVTLAGLATVERTGTFLGAPYLYWAADGDDRRLALTSLRAGPALAALVRLAVDDPGGTDLGGHPGAVGRPVAAPPGTLLATWEQDGAVVVVQSAGLSSEEVLAFAGTLGPAAPGDWERLEDEAERAPPVPVDSAGRVVAGRFDGARWQVGVVPFEGFAGEPGYEVGAQVFRVDGGFTANGGDAFCEAFGVAALWVEEGTVLYGLAPSSAAAVRIATEDDTTFDVPVEPPAPGWPVVPFATFLEGELTEFRGAAAVDDLGTSLATLTVDFPFDAAAGSGGTWCGALSGG